MIMLDRPGVNQSQPQKEVVPPQDSTANDSSAEEEINVEDIPF